ncbi:MAG: radical SAM protein [Candidatus Aminicenantes bacterium]|nr:radical SAM protein [Candidatus Aminicenantes bacterium]
MLNNHSPFLKKFSLSLENNQRSSWTEKMLDFAAHIGPKAFRFTPLRKLVASSLEEKLRSSAQSLLAKGEHFPGVVLDRLDLSLAILHSIERALAEGRLGERSARKLLQIFAGDVLVRKGEPSAKQRFLARHGVNPPEILLISPTKACNLRCHGCYADSGGTNEKLPWPIFERLVEEAHDLWGARFIVFSGGEPLVYRDQGKTVLDLVKQFNDCFFMMYTNGTLIDDEMAYRIGQVGNLMPAVSVEGLKEQTDQRRGPGVFEKIVAALQRLKREKVFYGISITATKDNAEHLFSDEVIDFYFEEMKANFAWVFHYMPIGRSFTLSLLPSPKQRIWMWRRSWELVRKRKIFIADFWNSGTASYGCIAAGREGGYLAVDWNGWILPCVFMPYSPVNIIEAYAQGKTLEDVWANPFFARLRQWQREYGYKKKIVRPEDRGNWMMPCLIRDHYQKFRELISDFQLTPQDQNAAAALQDPEYFQGMVAYNQAVAELMDPIWKNEYSRLIS